MDHLCGDCGIPCDCGESPCAGCWACLEDLVRSTTDSVEAHEAEYEARYAASLTPYYGDQGHPF